MLARCFNILPTRSRSSMQTPSEESPQLCVCPVRQTPAENLVKAPQRASQIKEFQESYGSAAREWQVPASEGSVAKLANRTGFPMSSEHSDTVVPL